VEARKPFHVPRIPRYALYLADEDRDETFELYATELARQPRRAGLP
jgi:hypothetical protein